MKNSKTDPWKKYSELIVDYITAHPLLSVDGIERELGLPQSTIGQALSGKRMVPKRHIFPILCLLAGYGLEIEGHTLSYDRAGGMLSGLKITGQVGTEEKEGAFRYLLEARRFLAMNYFDLP